jgi:predicted branched-subunit amino acid permease
MTDTAVCRQERRAVVEGMRAAAPIAIAVFAFGASFGILARDAGMGVAPPIVMSVTTFAGSAQFAVASVLESGGAAAAAIAAAILLNLRYLAIGMSVAPSLRGGPLRRLPRRSSRSTSPGRCRSATVASTATGWWARASS